MTHFQLLGLGFLACLIAVGVARVVRQRSAWRSSFVWILLWLAAGISIAKPEITSVIADFLGIGRGADLVFYCSILGMLMGFFWVYLKLRQIDSNLTQLVRHLALEEKRDRSAGTPATKD